MQRIRAGRDQALLDPITRVNLALSLFPGILPAAMVLLERSEVEFAGQNLPVDRNPVSRERRWVHRGAYELLVVVIDEEVPDIIEM